jgi:transcriptional regulator with XRE-family HTH domain
MGTNAITAIDAIDLDHIGELIDLYKKAFNIRTDRELSARLGVSYMAVYRWRRKQVEPATLALMRIARGASNLPASI